MPQNKRDEHQQIDHRIIKLTIGCIALGLAFFVQLLSGTTLNSISESYHYPSRDYFVGGLFSVSVLFFSFRGNSALERILTIIACVFAVIVAIAPCACSRPPHVGSALHFPAAIGLFVILGYFCWAFRRRASKKLYAEAKIRMKIYSLCLGGMVVVLLSAIYYKTNQEHLDIVFPAYLFWMEALGLVSFGLSWLVASRTLPLISNPHERYRITDGRALDDEPVHKQ
jgi:hypothetical protein